MALAKASALMALLPAAAGLVQPRQLLANQCNFTNPPEIPYFWDEGCPQDGTSLGCLADGVHPQCRFCGQGDYKEVYCPASWCEFDNPPHLPYFWDSGCAAAGGVGCLADGKHMECRFCGEFPYNGTVHCPENSGAITPADTCMFDNKPAQPYFWDASCEDGMLGCKADGKHIGCRFCGAGDYASISCPASLCTFAPDAHTHDYYWEPLCWDTSAHILGCNADGVHPECRYCGGSGEYASIPCPQGSGSR